MRIEKAVFNVTRNFVELIILENNQVKHKEQYPGWAQALRALEERRVPES